MACETCEVKRARLLNEDQVTVTFADVAGVDEAKEEERCDFAYDIMISKILT